MIFYLLSVINLSLTGCMTSVAVVDTSTSAVVSTGEVLVDTIDFITPDIFDDD